MEKIEIDKNGEAPLYLQLARQIEQQAANGILVPGERLLSEIKMANESGLSVGTVRKRMPGCRTGALYRKSAAGELCTGEEIRERTGEREKSF